MPQYRNKRRAKSKDNDARRGKGSDVRLSGFAGLSTAWLEIRASAESGAALKILAATGAIGMLYNMTVLHFLPAR